MYYSCHMFQYTCITDEKFTVNAYSVQRFRVHNLHSRSAIGRLRRLHRLTVRLLSPIPGHRRLHRLIHDQFKPDRGSTPRGCSFACFVVPIGVVTEICIWLGESNVISGAIRPARRLRLVSARRAQPPVISVDRQMVTVAVVMRVGTAGRGGDSALNATLWICRVEEERELACFVHSAGPVALTWNHFNHLTPTSKSINQSFIFIYFL